MAVEETRERLQQFVEGKKVASLNVGEHRTGTVLEVQARTLTEYLARAVLETSEQRDHRHAVKAAAVEHQSRLGNDFGRAQSYREAARDMASDAKDRAPEFTDKEKINLEIFAERQNDEAERESYLELARGESTTQVLEISDSRGR